MTPTGHWRFSILRIYWDDQTQPSRRVPGRRFLRHAAGAALRAGLIAGRLREPGQRVQLLLADAVPEALPHHDGEHRDGGDGAVLPDRLRARRGAPTTPRTFTRSSVASNPLPYKEVYTILDGVKGRGHYVGTYMAWGVNNTGWWGEGEIKFYLDGDSEWPTICGTGTEDYFCGSYNFENKQTKQYQEFTTPYAGLHQVIRPDGVYQSQQRFGMYRWHITDPIRFKQDMRMTMQALGWRSGGTISAAAGRHRIGGVLVSDAADGQIPAIAGQGFAGNHLITTADPESERRSIRSIAQLNSIEIDRGLVRPVVAVAYAHNDAADLACEQCLAQPRVD